MASNELLTEQFYFSNTMPRTNLAVRVAGAEFGIAGEMRRLPAYFDNPDRPMPLSSSVVGQMMARFHNLCRLYKCKYVVEMAQNNAIRFKQD